MGVGLWFVCQSVSQSVSQLPRGYDRGYTATAQHEATSTRTHARPRVHRPHRRLLERRMCLCNVRLARSSLGHVAVGCFEWEGVCKLRRWAEPNDQQSRFGDARHDSHRGSAASRGLERLRLYCQTPAHARHARVRCCGHCCRSTIASVEAAHVVAIAARAAEADAYEIVHKQNIACANI